MILVRRNSTGLCSCSGFRAQLRALYVQCHISFPPCAFSRHALGAPDHFSSRPPSSPGQRADKFYSSTFFTETSTIGCTSALPVGHRVVLPSFFDRVTSTDFMLRYSILRVVVVRSSPTHPFKPWAKQKCTMMGPPTLVVSIVPHEHV